MRCHKQRQMAGRYIGAELAFRPTLHQIACLFDEQAPAPMSGEDVLPYRKRLLRRYVRCDGRLLTAAYGTQEGTLLGFEAQRVIALRAMKIAAGAIEISGCC
jgi:hypothetical protein